MRNAHIPLGSAGARTSHADVLRTRDCQSTWPRPHDCWSRREVETRFCRDRASSRLTPRAGGRRQPLQSPTSGAGAGLGREPRVPGRQSFRPKARRPPPERERRAPSLCSSALTSRVWWGNAQALSHLSRALPLGAEVLKREILSQEQNPVTVKPPGLPGAVLCRVWWRQWGSRRKSRLSPGADLGSVPTWPSSQVAGCPLYRQAILEWRLGHYNLYVRVSQGKLGGRLHVVSFPVATASSVWRWNISRMAEKSLTDICRLARQPRSAFPTVEPFGRGFAWNMNLLKFCAHSEQSLRTRHQKALWPESSNLVLSKPCPRHWWDVRPRGVAFVFSQWLPFSLRMYLCS